MKQLLIIALVSLSTLAGAQSESRLKTQITDNTQTLTIQFDGHKNGRPIHYKRTFDVAGMTSFQKDVLKYRAFASQNVVPPLHDMLVSIITIFGIISFIMTLLILGYQSRKNALTN